MQRYSRQREAILSLLRTHFDHPTAEALYEELHKTHPNISLGTVYRNLSLLSEAGVITRLATHEKDHFDGNTAPHAHFFCDGCGSIKDLDGSFVREPLDEDGQLTGYEPRTVLVSIHGLCPECLNKMKEEL